MELIIFFLNYNWVFKYYMVLLLVFNLSIFYNFVYFLNNENKTTNNENKPIINLKYMFKKIIKITKNPIIFEYQLKQINKITINSNKYVKYENIIQNVKNMDEKTINKYYKKIKQILSERKLTNINEIIIKLLCVNFQ